jgi:DNA polymerase elongation subunit (family B)
VRLDGHILDVFPDERNDLMVLYLRTPRGVERVVDSYWPTFNVVAPLEDLQGLGKRLEALPAVRGVQLERRRAALMDRDVERDVLTVEVGRYRALRSLASTVDKLGAYRDYELFNVDIRLAQRYLIDRDAFPMARVSVSQSLECLDQRLALEYEVPRMPRVELEIEARQTGRVLRESDPLERAMLKEMPPVGGPAWQRGADRNDGKDPETLVLEATDGDEAEVLEELTRALDRSDADILETRDGDAALIPYLRARAEASGADLRLGREADPATAARKERSYHSYGRIVYKPPYQALRGRIHVDRSSSFLHRESGLYGLVDLSRISQMPLQILSRLSPGTAISAMQVHHALTNGYLVQWRKNVPEAFKTAEELCRLDRGGMILEPRVGVFGGVVEMDFASLYPNLIVKHNISPETLNCPCCRRPDGLVPGTPYHTCEDRDGLIPAVLRPVLQRRFYFKRMRGHRPERRSEYEEKQLILKWLLVTCFGYTGYKNARFGRIECHESITASSREVMLEAMEVAESAGYEVLHGIVDSMWMQSVSEAATDPHVVSERISQLIGIDLDLEGVYKWIVFLPCKGTGVGALNRYYGAMEDGTLKVRGIELRRRDTPDFMRKAQTDMLDVLVRADSPEEFAAMAPEALRALRRRADELRSGDVDPAELLFTTSPSKELDEYTQLNMSAAALRQLKEEGVDSQPGRSVQYLVADATSRNHHRKVLIRERLDAFERYDLDHYLKVLARTGESLLLPLGYTEDVVRDALSGQRQVQLPSDR